MTGLWPEMSKLNRDPTRKSWTQGATQMCLLLPFLSQNFATINILEDGLIRGEQKYCKRDLVTSFSLLEFWHNKSSVRWGMWKHVKWDLGVGAAGGGAPSLLPEAKTTWETSIVWQNHCVHRSKSACTLFSVISLASSPLCSLFKRSLCTVQNQCVVLQVSDLCIIFLSFLLLLD